MSLLLSQQISRNGMQVVVELFGALLSHLPDFLNNWVSTRD